jgi:DNA-directed RNA polymerase subunit RPC12/RpoP
MDTSLVETLRARFDQSGTDGLLEIWQQDDRDSYSDEAFEAIRELLAARGHSYPTKRPTADIQKEIEDAVAKSPTGPQGDRYVCTNCYTAFRRDGLPKRSFLGYERLTCPECTHRIKYPLTNGYRLFYRCFIVIVPLICVAMFYFGGSVALPGLAWFAALFALSNDYEKKWRVQKAWFEHEQKGRPASEKGGRCPTLAERDPIRWYHVVFAVLLPYVSVPWGILNLFRGHRRSGRLLLLLPVIVIGTMLAVAFVVSRFQE